MQTKIRVNASYLEIYNENVNDLLDGSKRNLAIREDKAGEIVVDNLTILEIQNEEQLFQCLEQGALVRMTAATKMN